MSEIAITKLALAVTCGAAVGFAVGLVYFALLRRSVTDYVRGTSVGRPMLLTVLRVAIAGAAFWLLVQWSAAAGIAGLLGFTLARVRLRTTAGSN
jgi:dipeptide/tripeptide permease